MVKFDDDYLDSLMADLEKAKENLQSNKNDSKKPKMNTSYSSTTIQESPNRKIMTTTTKYEYEKYNTNNEPFYQNNFINNEDFEISDFKKTSSDFMLNKKHENLNNSNYFFENKKKNQFDKNQFNVKQSSNNYEQYENSYKQSKSVDTHNVDNLILNLEYNLANPEKAFKWRGEQVKPITMTEYYEESKKTSYLNNPTENHKTQKVQSILPAQSNETKSMTSLSNQYQSYSKHNNYLSSQNKQTRASNATNELDDLMASLSDFNIKDKSRFEQTQSNIQSKYSHQQQSNKQQFDENNKKKQYEHQYQKQLFEHQKKDGNKQQNQYEQKYEKKYEQCEKQYDEQNSKKSFHQKKEKSDIIENPDYAVCKPRNQRDASYRSSCKTKNTTTVNEELSKETKKNIENNELDSIIGSIEIKMNKEGINTSAKGSCYSCKKSVVGQVITALGRIYHPEHFTCAHCNIELGERTFFERDGECYCELDYHNLFAPKCNYCTASITGRQKCVSALNQTFHAEHFFCAECSSQFTEEKGYHEHNNQAYCSDCYLNVFAQKCNSCNKPITSSFISALGSQWHPECFVCTQCKCEFASGAFFEYESRPYCETHFHAIKGTLCAGCHKPITGRCVTAMFRKFHPEHFVCSFCLRQLNKGTFKEQNDKPFCHNCFEKLFG